MMLEAVPDHPDLVARTDYQGFLDAGEGRISFHGALARHAPYGLPPVAVPWGTTRYHKG
jgi:hypothetical protein